MASPPRADVGSGVRRFAPMADPEQPAPATEAEAIVLQAEAVVDSGDVVAAERRLRVLEERWAAKPEGSRDPELKRRFTQARGEHRRVMEVVRAEAARVKGELCAEAERLSESTDWRATADAMRDLQRRWKAAGGAGREEDRLWARFRKAQDAFFARRTEAFATRDRERAESLAAKEAIVDRAERLSRGRDRRAGKDELPKLFAEWKQTGPVRRAEGDALWARLTAAADAIRAAADSGRDQRAAAQAEKAAAEIERHEERLNYLEYRERELAERLAAMGDEPADPFAEQARAALVAEHAEIASDLAGQRERLRRVQTTAAGGGPTGRRRP